MAGNWTTPAPATAACRRAIHIVGDKSRRVPNRCGSTMRPFELPNVFATRWPEIETGQGRQIGRHKRNAELFKQCGTRHKAPVPLTEDLHHEIAVFQRRRTHTNRNVDTFPDQIDNPIGRLEMNGTRVSRP